MTRAAALGVSGSAIVSILSACGDDERQPQTGEGQAADGGQAGTGGDIYTEEAARQLNDSLAWPESVIPDPSQEVTITVAHTWDASFLPRQEHFDKFFAERHPNIKIEAEVTPWDDFLQKYLTQAAGGTLPDVMYCHFSWAQNLIEQGLFLPLGDYIAGESEFNLGDFTEPSLGYYERNGQLYGLAYDCGPIMLFYNKEIFDSAGLEYPSSGWTMEDLKNAAVELTGGSGRDKVFGLRQIPYPRIFFAPVHLLPFGGRFVNEDETQSLFAEPASITAAEWWMEMYLDHGAMPSPADEQALDAANPFTLGRAAMAIQGSWEAPALFEQADFDWAIADLPPGPDSHSTAAVGSCYAITEQSSNADAAWIYLNEYLSTAGQTFMWASTGRGSPARKSAWDAYLKSQFAPEGADLVFEALNSYATSDGVFYRPTTPEVNSTVTPIWDRVVAGDLSVADGCREITEKIDPILAQNRR